MNREVLYRGFQKTWIFGGISIFENTATIYDINCIVNSAYEVELESVGEFTGITDKKDIKVFEGDLCKYHHNSSKWLVSYTFQVVFKGGAFYAFHEREMLGKIEQMWTLLSHLDSSKFKVVSNVYDNKKIINK